MNASGWRAGAAKVVITPTEPMWLAGWAVRREPATGTAMELYAKALALEDESGERVIIVTADLIALPRALTDAVARRAGIERDRILFNASHTHTGPEVRPDKVPFFEIPAEFAARIPEYVALLEHKLVRVIQEALAHIAPVILHARRASATFAQNRRAGGDLVDHDVPILAAERPDGSPLAIVFGYACHNLVLPPTFCEYHGDYAGVAQKALEERFPGGTALFLAGAGADQDPAPRGTLELAEQHGVALAQAVAHAIALGPPAAGRHVAGGRPAAGGPGLRIAFEDISLDLQPEPTREKLSADLASIDAPMRRKAAWLLDAMQRGAVLPSTLTCPVQVIRIGDEVLLIALGGEPVVEFAHRFKRDFAGPLVWTAGYSNDMFGYLPTRKVLQEGGYEGGRAALWSALPAPLAESAEERVGATVRRLVLGARASRPHP